MEKTNEESFQLEDETIKFNEIKFNFENNKKSPHNIIKDINK